METKEIFIRFADIGIRFSFPTAIKIPEELSVFCCEDGEEINVDYRIQLLEKLLDIDNKPVVSYKGVWIYPFQEGILRVFSQLTEKDGCQVACYTSKRNNNILYYPASKWDYYAGELHFLHLIGIEELLLEKNAFLLHSSVVKINGYTVLFSGPSGVGKSTQASLWVRYLGADIVNGDRCVIRKNRDLFYGCGSPWCGTSQIYRREMEPLKGIFILEQAEENEVQRLGKEAFIKIYQQSVVNAWNREFVVKMMDLITELLEVIPVYRLSCRPDKAAVMLAYSTLFKGDI